MTTTPQESVKKMSALEIRFVETNPRVLVDTHMYFREKDVSDFLSKIQEELEATPKETEV